MYGQEILFEAKDISKRFPGVQALRDVGITLHKGEVLALVGENGAGKSTLMNILLGGLQPDGGSMTLKGKDYTPKSPAQALESGISMIHQELVLAPYMTVAENIWLGREEKFSSNGYLQPSKLSKAAKELMDGLGIPLDADAVANRLGVAEMQLVELVRAISYDSDIIIMDEPTSSFTNKEIEILYRIVRELSSRGVAIIFITHKMEEIYEICDTVTVLRDGGWVGTHDVGDVTKDDLISMMVGRKLENLYPKEEVEVGEEVLRVNGLTRAGYFDDVSFEVRRGEILGFCGLVGSGRSEIMECLFGIEQADKGEVLLNGKTLRARSTMEAIRRGMAMVTEDRLRRGLIHMLPVSFNLSIACLDSVSSRGFVDKKKEMRQCRGMSEKLEIKISGMAQEAGQLSGGNQQKVIIGKWLLTDPEILILDEPTRGIDVGAKSEIYKLIGELAGQGKAILMVSSELPELMGVCDRIVVISKGRVAATVPRPEFDEELLMGHAFSRH